MKNVVVSHIQMKFFVASALLDLNQIKPLFTSLPGLHTTQMPLKRLNAKIFSIVVRVLVSRYLKDPMKVTAHTDWDRLF